MTWIEENLKSNLEVIEDLPYLQLKQMVTDREFVAVYVCKCRDFTSFSPDSLLFSISLDSANCDTCEEALQNLEDIDDDTEAVGVRMVKTDDQEFADMVGIDHFPSLVYYEHGNPHIYDGMQF